MEILLIVLAYVIVAIWYISSNGKEGKFRAAVGIMLSAGLTYYFWEEMPIGRIVFIVLGIIFVLFYLAETDSTAKTPKREERKELANKEEQKQRNKPQHATVQEGIPVAEPLVERVEYRDIRLAGCTAKAIGEKENFNITVDVNGITYVFKAKDGIICSYRSSKMHTFKDYEVR